MKLRIARKIVDIETNGHWNHKWFLKNSRGTECSPWRVSTRREAAKRVEKSLRRFV